MRNIFELLHFYRETLLLILAVLISLGLIVTGETPQSQAIQRAYAGIVGSIPKIDFKLNEYMSYRVENDYLRRRVTQISLQNAALADAARENERLREMLRFTEQSPYFLQAGEVIGYGLASALSTITVNIGSTHLVRENQPVLSMDGLIGKTLTVAENASVVQLVTDRNFRVSVKVGPEAYRGIVEPIYDQYARITGILLNTRVNVGDQVLTSGFSDIYPENLVVGVVDEVEHVPGDTFARIIVRFSVVPAEVEHVFVMLDSDTNP
ncbi:rod shape-determining protein MreC [Candidatus Neomarinimicrobiota bacterium]